VQKIINNDNQLESISITLKATGNTSIINWWFNTGVVGKVIYLKCVSISQLQVSNPEIDNKYPFVWIVEGLVMGTGTKLN
jgi:hypothetical protein